MTSNVVVWVDLGSTPTEEVLPSEDWERLKNDSLEGMTIKTTDDTVVNISEIESHETDRTTWSSSKPAFRCYIGKDENEYFFGSLLDIVLLLYHQDC